MDTKNANDYRIILKEVEHLRDLEETESDRILFEESREIRKLREIVDEISEPVNILFTLS